MQLLHSTFLMITIDERDYANKEFKCPAKTTRFERSQTQEKFLNSEKMESCSCMMMPLNNCDCTSTSATSFRTDDGIDDMVSSTRDNLENMQYVSEEELQMNDELTLMTSSDYCDRCSSSAGKNCTFDAQQMNEISHVINETGDMLSSSTTSSLRLPHSSQDLCSDNPEHQNQESIMSCIFNLSGFHGRWFRIKEVSESMKEAAASRSDTASSTITSSERRKENPKLRTKSSSSSRRSSFFSSSMSLLSFLLLISLSIDSCVAQDLKGHLQKCDNEGEVFMLPVEIQNPCLTCLCKGGRVECEKQQCPSLQGCFLIVSGQKEGCCEVCKGCKVGNVTYPSGTETMQDCVKTTCTAGVLTRSQIHCYTPCTHPVPPKPGQCCPTCDSCSLNGREYRHGEEAILPEDPCVRCKCQRGSLTCTKHACPVLACPASATYLEKGECCPKCNGSRTRYVPKKVCLLGDKAYPTGTNFRLDTCTNCTCVDNTAVCDRLSCPPLDCDPSHQIMVQGSCCPKCAEPEPILPRAQCLWKDEIYQNGERWDVSNCRACICDWGKVRCTEQMCPKNPPCPWGYKLKYLPGKCCPECVGEDGVCTVFGDPHYRTFDGRVFNFQGACKYVLTSDCKGKSFAVRVRNDARESRAFSWTRTVTLKVREARVTLGQKMRIKVNGKRVALPYNHGTLSITQDGYTATVETGVGVKLLWDGDSFLEVTVPHALKGRMCGLCGNFNGNKTDDFVTRKGGPVNHPSAFGQSWRVGGKKACTRPEEVKGPEPICRRNYRARKIAEKMCEPLRIRDYDRGVFSSCHKAVPMDRFFKSCTFDMCECPVGRKCHCEVFTAYARACERSGIELGDWRERTGCSHKKKWRT